ncbi:TonB-dependent receptor, partial [bacterium]
KNGLDLLFFQWPNCIKEESEYRNDTLVRRTSYHRNCNIKMVESFRNGQREGYTKEARSGADLDPEKSFAVRTALRWNPSPSLDVQLNADRGYHNMPVVVHSSLGANFDPERIELDSAPREDRDYWGVSLDAAYDLGSVKLISVTGYRGARLTNVIDTDAGPTRAIQFSQFDATAQWSQELRLNSAPKTRLQWLAGIYLFQEDADTFSPIFLDFTENLGLPSPTTQTIDASNRTKAFALFGQASFKLTDQLTISGGLRWSKEQKIFTFNQQFTIDIPPLFSSYPRSRQKTRWTDVSPRIAIDYRASDNLLFYASYSDGFKSGGSTSVSLITTPVPNVFAPESLEAFEAGIKSDWFNDDLRVNITAFHYDYKDLQVRTTDAFGFLIVRNAANARVDGLELEMSAQPIRGLDLTAIAAVLDARYGEFIDPVTLADYSGTRLNRAPKLKASFGAQYAFRLESGAEFAVRGEYEHMSRLYHQPGNLTAFSRAPTHLFNGRLAYRTADRRWSIALLAKNLTNERRIGHNFVVLGEPRSTITPPRTLVLEVCFTR